jgi:heme/copper-type cytochrome/quinol oxidase subunit 1
MRRALPWLVAGLGAVLVAAGVVVFTAANRGAADFGWSSYAPLEPTDDAYRSAITYTFSGGTTVLWTGQHLLGAGLVVLGLLVLNGVGGWLLGRRVGRRAIPRA